MSKVLFCYDGPLKKDKENQYYGSALNDELFSRYEIIATDVKIAIRVKQIEEENMTNKFSKISSEKYKIVECPNVSSIKGQIFNFKKCKEILKEEIKNVDYVIARLPSMIGNLAVDIAKNMNKPYLIELVGCPWDALWNHSLKGKMFAPFMTYMTKRRVKNAPYVLYVTREFLQKRYPTKGKSINCSNVILDNFDDKIIEEKKKQILDKKQTNIITTTAAINVKFKGQKYVIKALKNLKKKGIIFKYWLIGGGDKAYLNKFVEKYKLKEQVFFLGPLPHNEVFGKLKETDIYIQPSKQEGLPRALIEAMSMGCVCLGAKTGGIPELLDKEFIFPKGNIKKIEKLLQKINEEKSFKQITRNFEKSKEYNRETLKTKRDSFYKEFANETITQDF